MSAPFIYLGINHAPISILLQEKEEEEFDKICTFGFFKKSAGYYYMHAVYVHFLFRVETDPRFTIMMWGGDNIIDFHYYSSKVNHTICNGFYIAQYTGFNGKDVLTREYNPPILYQIDTQPSLDSNIERFKTKYSGLPILCTNFYSYNYKLLSDEYYEKRSKLLYYNKLGINGGYIPILEVIPKKSLVIDIMPESERQQQLFMQDTIKPYLSLEDVDAMWDIAEYIASNTNAVNNYDSINNITYPIKHDFTAAEIFL